MLPRYKPPKLDGNRVAFKGKRWWIIEVDEDHQFAGHPFCGEKFVVYDKLEGWILASVNIDEDGIYDCVHTCGQHEFHVKVRKLEDIGRIVDKDSRNVCKSMS